MGCRTQEYTPESMSLGWLGISPKTALCDFAMRYEPKPIERIAGSKSIGSEGNPTKTVECLKIMKLKESIAHTTRNRIIIMS